MGLESARMESFGRYMFWEMRWVGGWDLGESLIVMGRCFSSKESGGEDGSLMKAIEDEPFRACIEKSGFAGTKLFLVGC